MKTQNTNFSSSAKMIASLFIALFISVNLFAGKDSQGPSLRSDKNSHRQSAIQNPVSVLSLQNSDTSSKSLERIIPADENSIVKLNSTEFENQKPGESNENQKDKKKTRSIKMTDKYTHTSLWLIITTVILSLTIIGAVFSLILIPISVFTSYIGLVRTIMTWKEKSTIARIASIATLVLSLVFIGLTAFAAFKVGSWIDNINFGVGM